MRIFKRVLGAAGLAVLTLGLVVACGGGGASFVGIDRLGVTTGTVTGFGSVFVNGVEYSTDTATFDIDDGPGSQADLKVGQQVTIEWNSTDDGVTRRSVNVSYDDTVEGPIASIDLVTQSLVVLGQSVLIDAATSFDDNISPRDLTGLSVGQYVEVSGLIDGNGAVRATRIERVNQGDDKLEARGIVESLDTLTETFVINGLTVDYSLIISPPALANGLFVEVNGDSFDLVSGALVADRVQVEDEDLPGVSSGDDGEVEGYVTRFGSATDFDVAGKPVTTNGQTQFKDGTALDLALNVKVEVKGTVNASGVLVADEIEIKSGDSDGDGDDDSIDGRLEGDVTAVNAGARTLVIAGVTVSAPATTRFEDKSSADDRTFNIADISVGDYLEVRGTPGVGPTLTAVIVERDDASNQGLVRGAASSIAQPNLSVLGVPVTTDGGTQFRDSNHNALTANAFFGAISNGSEIQVKFTQSGGVILADELELEDQLN